MKLRYKGPSSIRQVTPAQFEHEGVTDHGYEADSEGLVINTLNGGIGFAADSRERVLDVTEAVADLLVAREPDQWELVAEEDAQAIEAADAEAAAAEAQRQAEIDAERQEVEDNRRRAEEEAAAHDDDNGEGE